MYGWLWLYGTVIRVTHQSGVEDGEHESEQRPVQHVDLQPAST